jgi:hypothetical protein
MKEFWLDKLLREVQVEPIVETPAPKEKSIWN